jgi:serine/threonine-protein kinase
VVVERFLREIDFISELDHPQIPKLLDSGVIGDLPFYVMPFIEGESLRTLLDRVKQLPVDEAVRITQGLVSPTAYAHARGIIHRDIKPANIILAGDQVYVLDFGVARAIVASADDRITSTGVAVGTPAYMSPEQALAEKDIDARSDIYSLACVTYEMIAGIPPFVGATAQAVMARRFVAPPPPLSEVRESVPPAIEHAVMRALCKAPADRWQTVAEFGAALHPGTNAVQSPKSKSIRWRFATKRRGLAAVIGVSALAGATVLIFARGRAPAESNALTLDSRRVAILYFEDLSPDHSLGYLAGGLTESLIRELGPVSSLQVISPNGVRPFRDKDIGLDSIAHKLRAGSIVEGSVQKSGGRIRVVAQVTDGATQTRLETANVERDAGELFLLEDDLAHEVAKLLRRRIGIEIRVKETEAGTRNPAARDLVFRADDAMDEAERLSVDNDTSARSDRKLALATSDSLLGEAQKFDPTWRGLTVKRGWVALELAIHDSGLERDQAFRRALRFANQSIRQDSRENAAAYELRGTTVYYMAVRLNFSGVQMRETLRDSQRDLQLAVAQDPALATAWGTLSRAYVALGNLGPAERAAKRAFATDAYLKDAPDILLSLYLADLMRDSVQASRDWCDQGRRDYPLDVRFVDCQLTLLAEDRTTTPDRAKATALFVEGNRLESHDQAAAAGRPFLPFYRTMMFAAVLARSGKLDSARAMAAESRLGIGVTPELVTDLDYEEAYVALLLGEKGKSLDLLARYLHARPTFGSLVSEHPRWRTLSSDTIFKRLVREAKAR